MLKMDYLPRTNTNQHELLITKIFVMVRGYKFISLVQFNKSSVVKTEIE